MGVLGRHVGTEGPKIMLWKEATVSKSWLDITCITVDSNPAAVRYIIADLCLYLSKQSKRIGVIINMSLICFSIIIITD